MKPTGIVLQNVRISYVHLFGEGKVGKDGGKPAWELSCLIPKSSKQVPAIRAAIAECKTANAAKLGTGGGIKHPLLDGDMLNPDEEFHYKGEEVRGHWFLRPKTVLKAPRVVDQQLNPILDREMVYSGCFANVSINFYAYEGSQSKGIAPGLEAVQFVRDGPRLDSVVDMADVFQVLE
jgi:hypothetical protein